MIVYASQQFSTRPELSIAYTVNISIGPSDIIRAGFTIDGSATALFLEKMQALNPDIEMTIAEILTQDDRMSITHSLQTDSHTFISIINGLKESSLIEIELANQVCRELPNLIQRARLFQKYQNLVDKDGITSGPRGRNVLRSRYLYVPTDDTSPKEEEWSTQIDIVMDRPNLFFTFNLFPSGMDTQKWSRSILTESQAYAMIKVYCDGCYLIFEKDKTYHLVVKNDSEIRQFDIYTKRDRSKLYKKSYFNLKNEKGEWIFNQDEVSASSLYSFINSYRIKQLFQFQLKLGAVNVLNRLASDSLQTLTIKRLVIQDRSLAWLPGLPDTLQDQALFYFLDTFIANLSFPNSEFSILRTFLNGSPKVLSNREHYSTEEIKKNLAYLRALYQQGNTKAAMLLAVIVYSGLDGPKDDHDNMKNFEVHLLSLFRPATTPQEEVSLPFRDLEEYKEITQNASHFPNKSVRDVFLLKYFEAKNSKELVATQLKQMDLGEFDESIRKKIESIATKFQISFTQACSI